MADTVGSGNDSPNPIYKKSTEPFWSFDPNDGPQIVGSPTWTEIPSANWRANNPPYKEGSVVVPPVQPPAPSFPYPDEGTQVLAFQNDVKQAYKDAGRQFPDPNDSDAYRHFCRYGYSCSKMPEAEAHTKHIKELRAQLGVS
jgi:hypothetical protein